MIGRDTFTIYHQLVSWVLVGQIVLRAPTAVQSKQYSSLRCVIALAQHTASVECRTMFEVTHAIVCHAMFCRHMPTVDT